MATSVRGVLLGIVLIWPAAVAHAQQQNETSSDEAVISRAAELLAEAEALWSAGKFKESLKPRHELLKIQEEVFGEASPEFLDALETFSYYQRLALETHDSLESMRRLIQLAEKLHGPDSWQLAPLRFELDYAERLAKWPPEKQRQLLEAERMAHDLSDVDPATALAPAEEMAALEQELIGKDHAYFANSLNMLANVHFMLSHQEQAEQFEQEALQIRRATLGPKHPDVASSLCSLATMYAGRNHYGEAEKCLQEALEILEPTVGVADEDYLNVVMALGAIYNQAGQAHRALEAYQRLIEHYGASIDGEAATHEALDILLERIRELADGDATGQWGFTYAVLLQQLGQTLYNQGDAQGSERYLREALAAVEELVGQQHPLYPGLLRMVATSVSAQHRYDEAATLLEQVVELQEQLENDGQLFEPLYDLGANQLAAGRLPAARQTRSRLIEMAQERWGNDDWRTVGYRLDLDEVELYERLQPAQREELHTVRVLNVQVLELYNQRRYTEAMPLAEKAADITRRLAGPRHPLYAFCLNDVAAQYEGLGKIEQARKIYTEAVNIYDEATGGDHPRVLTPLMNLGNMLDNVGAYSEAGEYLRRVVDIQRIANGETSFYYIGSLTRLATHYQDSGHRDEAEPLYRHALEVLERIAGPRSPAYAQMLTNLGTVVGAQGELHEAMQLMDQALDIFKFNNALRTQEYCWAKKQRAWLSYLREGNLGSALSDYQQTLALARQLAFPPTQMIGLLNEMGTLYSEAGIYAEAEGVLSEAQRLADENEAPRRYEAISVTQQRGVLAYRRGHYAEAKELLEASLARWNAALGETNAGAAECFDNLGTVLDVLGEPAEAERSFRQSLQMRAQLFGEQSVPVAESLNNLALLYEELGDTEQARAMLDDALAIVEEASPNSPRHAALLNNRALIDFNADDISKTRNALQRSTEMVAKYYGEDHPRYGVSLLNLADCDAAERQWDRALAQYQQALGIFEERLGKGHLAYSSTLRLIGDVHARQLDFDSAEPLFDQSYEITKNALGVEHPQLADAAVARALLRLAQRRPADAVADMARSLAVYRRYLELAAGMQSERQQFRTMEKLRGTLDTYLTLADEAKLPGDAAYEHVLAWKGAIFARQRLARLAREKPELADLFAGLQRVSSELANMAFTAPAPQLREAWNAEFERLTQDKEALEQELANHSAEFRDQQSAQQRTADDLLKSLPADTVFVDFLEYQHRALSDNSKETGELWILEPHLLAFVLCRGKPVERIDLGPVEPIATAVHDWRQTWGATPPEQQAEGNETAGQKLRRLVWNPLVPYLGERQTVLISPDGPLCRLPLVALPGREPSTYLLEERGLATVPVPQLLPELLAELNAPAAPAADKERALLLMGYVDFDAQLPPAEAQAPQDKKEIGEPPLTRTRRFEQPFEPLPYTLDELSVIRDFYEDALGREAPLERFSRDDATESAFREYAPRSRYIHLATHGFFASSDQASATDTTRGPADTARAIAARSGEGLSATGRHPGLLSGIVFAGVNQPAPRAGDDGILTALEVAELDLRGVDLAVLSACETGLGEVAGGEGTLGLQRAFQVAGARSVVVSLWRVSDRHTQALMRHFYENLWEKDLTKLEALRQAQLTLLREGADRSAVVLPAPGHNDQPQRLPPFYWAAFVLSGDWR